MTPLRKKMIADMVLRGLSQRTQQRYMDAVAGLAKKRLELRASRKVCFDPFESFAYSN